MPPKSSTYILKREEYCFFYRSTEQKSNSLAMSANYNFVTKILWYVTYSNIRENVPFVVKIVNLDLRRSIV